MKWIWLAAPLALAAPAQAAEITVAAKDDSYQPRSVSARVGDTIKFVNQDFVDHNVLVPTLGFAVNPGVMKPNQASTIPLGKAGTFDVHCVFHPGMKMKVTVAP
ncbi:MAG: amicyanin [Alphaproteobacteria bacterium]|nr:amicyanin [Alphaproteobacteria bacterium]